MELAAIAQFDAGILLVLRGDARGEFEQHVPGFLDRLEELTFKSADC
jgi:hypothetical protein